jgi:phosphoglycerate dehydrogenase-like enzyme
VLRVLSHVGRLDAGSLPPDVADRVEVVTVPLDGPLPEGAHGEVLVTVPRPAATLPALLDRGVRWVHLISTGIDQFPLELLGPDVVLTNSRGLSATPISEWVLACVLAAAKRLPESWVHDPPERWSVPDRPLGSLDGATLALLGLGGIGTAVARRALPFGMAVKALRRHPGPSPVPGVRTVGSVTQLVEGADHVVLVAPLTDETRGIVDRRAFAAMAPGAHLVNVARGALVVEDDLRAALDDGTVAVASIDTTDPEPLPAGHWMYHHPSVRLSPHISWSWSGAFDAMFQTLGENLRRRLAGDQLLSVVDPAEGY